LERKLNTTQELPIQHNHALWAVELDDDVVETSDQAARVISSVLPDSDVYPIHILDPQGLSWNGESAYERSQRLEPMATRALEWIRTRASELLGGAHIKRPFVADCNDVNLFGQSRHTARKLAHWAKQFHADLIVVNYSHHNSMARALWASLPEVLLEETELPVLIVTPNCKTIPGPVSDIIFPTDFSEACRQTFENAIEWARRFDATLKLFYKTAPTGIPVVPGSALLLGEWSEFYAETVDDLELSKLSTEWLSHARQSNVVAEFIQDDTPVGAAHAIADFVARFTNPLLVMSTCHGPLESGLWGSITRDVMSQAKAPVLVLRG
jgi:nucleotide-binding universal stress UspA family protein